MVSDLITDLEPDAPVAMDASFQVGSKQDRRNIDAQIQVLQKRLIESGLSGYTASYFQLSQSSSPIAAGEAFCISNDGDRVVTRANTTALTDSFLPFGIAATAAGPGTVFRGIVLGMLPVSVAMLAVGTASHVVLNVTTARLDRNLTPGSGDIVMGACTADGLIMLTPPRFGGSGGGGGGITVIGTPNNGDVPMWNGAQWVSTPDGGIQITSFAAVTPIVETGASVGNPAFTAALNATPTTATLTNSANSESKDVHLTPSSFASSQLYAFTTPAQTVTFHYNVALGGSSTTRNATVVAGQRCYAGKVASGNTSIPTLVAAATYNTLGTTGAFSFAITDDGTHEIQFAIPARFTLNSIKDHTTGFGIGVTLVTTASFTNASGFAESYKLYKFDAAVNGTVTADVVSS